MNEWILTKLLHLNRWDMEKNWLDFDDLDPIFKVMLRLSLLENGLSAPCLLKEWVDFDQTCTALLFGTCQTSSVCSEMTGQWLDRSAMSGRKTLSPPGPMSYMYLCGLALRIWTSFWRREDFDGMDMWNAPVVQSRQPLTYRLMESVGLGGPKWHGSSWQRGIAESGSSRLSTLMIDVPGDLVWDLPCVQQASYLEGGPVMWMLPLYLHVNQKSDYIYISELIIFWWPSPHFQGQTRA